MNTIATNRHNASHGEPVESIIDGSGRLMQSHSPGTALLDGLLADAWDGGDPWGSVMEGAFALEYACQHQGIPTSPHFSSPYTTGDPDDGWVYVGYRDAIADGDVTEDDIVFARTVFEMMTAAFKLAGLDY
jgi:hypothetical protein